MKGSTDMVDRVIDRSIEAMGRYWPLTAGFLSAIGAFGAPKVIDTANPWVLFILGFLVFAIGHSLGTESGATRARDSARADAERDAELYERKTKADNDAEIARMRAAAEIEDDRAREDRNRARQKEAEERNREVQSELNMFSDTQLSLMLHIAESEDTKGYYLIRHGRNDEKIANFLIVQGVTIYIDNDERQKSSRWRLSPIWSQIVRDNKDLILQRLKASGLSNNLS